MNELPSTCKEHPNADIVHEWENVKFVWDGIQIGPGLNKNHKYYCSVCHKKLCSDHKYNLRRKIVEIERWLNTAPTSFTTKED